MLDKRTRSPNYPAMSLPEAIQRAEMVYKNQHTYGAPRETVAKSMGYNSLNGASATAISALIKYGLLEGRGEEIRISDRAMRILHPETPEEKSAAIKDAATSPTLFQELKERFPDRLPSEEVLRNHLIRSGFAPQAVSSVILAYRETIEFSERAGGSSDSPLSIEPQLETRPSQAVPANLSAPTPPTAFPQAAQLDERNLVLYSFEDGGLLRIAVAGDISTEEALEMAETQIAIKRKELERRDARAKAAVAMVPDSDRTGDPDA